MTLVIARLAGEGNFRNVYRRGRRWRGPYLNLSALAVPGAPRTRVAVVVSRQVSPRASKRNLVKRRLWAGLREHRAALPAQGYHVIVTGQPKLLHLAYAELARELGSFIRRLPKT